MRFTHSWLLLRSQKFGKITVFVGNFRQHENLLSPKLPTTNRCLFTRPKARQLGMPLFSFLETRPKLTAPIDANGLEPLLGSFRPYSERCPTATRASAMSFGGENMRFGSHPGAVQGPEMRWARQRDCSIFDASWNDLNGDVADTANACPSPRPPPDWRFPLQGRARDEA